MKRSNLLIIISVFVFGHLAHLQAQIGLGNMSTYNYTSGGLINQKEIGEAVAYDGVNSIAYVAGEQRKDNAGQGIRIVKYDGSLTQLNSKVYDSLPFKEYVTQLLFKSNKLYVICNSIENSTGKTYLLMLRYSSNLVLEKSKWFLSSGYNSPANATFINLSSGPAIFLACYKYNGNANNFSVLKVDDNFGFISAYNPSVTTFNRIPKDIVFGPGVDQGVYVGGGISDNATGKTAVWALRLTSNLVFSWETTGTLKTLKNIYNSVQILGDSLYAGGCEKSSSRYLWTLRKIDKNNGNVLKTATYGSIDYNSEVIKITRAENSGVTVTGYLSSSILNEYKAKVVNYSTNLTSPQYSSVTLPFNSTLTDAATSYNNGIGTTAITGFESNGTEKNMFFYMFDYNTGAQLFNYSFSNRDAGGKKLIPLNGAFAGILDYIVTGYSDKKSGILIPDYQITTWRFYNQIPRLSSDVRSPISNSFQIYPNPSSDWISIEGQQAINNIILYDSQGKEVFKNEWPDDKKIQQINIGHLPRGLYFIRLNNTSFQKVIKN